MESKDKMTVQICDMIDDLMTRSWRMKNNGKADAEADIYGYPFEPDNAISAEPLGFYESALRLKTEANELFGFIHKLNRHSPLFLKASSLMEKLIRQLGVCCITRAVLEQEGNDFDLLEGLTISWLKRIAAFNVRKCYAAFMEDREMNRFHSAVLDLSIRWTALDKRLSATEEKIEKIKSGKIRADLPDKALPLSEAGAPEAHPEQTSEMTSLASPRAFSVDRAALAETEKASVSADFTPGPDEAASASAPAAAGEPAEVSEEPGQADTEISSLCMGEEQGGLFDPAETVFPDCILDRCLIPGMPGWMIRSLATALPAALTEDCSPASAPP